MGCGLCLRGGYFSEGGLLNGEGLIFKPCIQMYTYEGVMGNYFHFKNPLFFGRVNRNCFSSRFVWKVLCCLGSVE